MTDRTSNERSRIVEDLRKVAAAINSKWLFQIARRVEALPVETEARQMQPYLIRLLKEVERIVPPPQNCHHCFTFAQFGSDSAGWTDKLALQINREGRFVCIFVDVDDFQKPPDALASDIAGALSGEPANTQFGVSPGQYTSAVKSGGAA